MDVKPKLRRFEEIRKFTSNFSHELGKGSYGIVYKGIDDEEKDIAVKVLYKRKGSSLEEEFKREFESLLMLRHPNIIQLVGYCYEKTEKYNPFTERSDPIIRTALCFEYAPNGNLGKHLSDEGDGLDWGTCYKIIKGICAGLCYLHNGPLGSEIWHLDLKPQNILLNHDMVPKIADFGLSRLVKNRTSKATLNIFGTLKYTPMEFKSRQVISKEFDIYGLGVIIWEIVAGTNTYNETDDFSEEVIHHVHEKWRKKLSPVYWQQVKTCLEVGVQCLDIKRHKRPKITKIMDDLNLLDEFIPRASVFYEPRNNPESPEVQEVYGSGEQKDKARAIERAMKQDKEGMMQSKTVTAVSGLLFYLALLAKNHNSAAKKTGGVSEKDKHVPLPPRTAGSDANKVVLYVTTMGGIPKTFNDCNTIRAALRAYRVDFVEKDLFDRPDHLREVRELLAGTSYKLPVPVLCINGKPVGDAGNLLELRDQERLAALFE